MFPRYFVLEQLLKNYKTTDDLDDFFIISVQHLMRSTGSLFETIIRWGINPNHIFLTGKIYSAHDETIKKLGQLNINIRKPTIPDKLGYYSDFLEKDVLDLWDQLIRNLTPSAKIIILDDGGFVLRSVPDIILKKHMVFGIEQTTSGIRLQDTFKKFPVIHVATSAAKTIIEPPIVSEAVKIQLGEVIQKLKPKTIGIIGFGHVGKALAKEFYGKYEIIIFDIEKSALSGENYNYHFSKSREDLYRKCDIIIGATGKDISDRNWLKDSNSDKTLISVSSGDIEFNKLIRNCYPYLVDDLKSSLQDLNLSTANGHSLKVLRGGLVANFTGKADSSPGHIIQMTRGLLFSAMIQGIFDLDKIKKQHGAVMLDPKLQSEVVNLWFEDQPERRYDYEKDIILKFHDIKWLESNSK